MKTFFEILREGWLSFALAVLFFSMSAFIFEYLLFEQKTVSFSSPYKHKVR